MKIKSVVVLLILIMIISVLVHVGSPVKASSTFPSDLYVGIDVAYESVQATQQLIDGVSSYTNIVVLGCTGYYNNERLTTLAQYAYDKGLYFMVYSDTSRFPSRNWLGNASSLWGDKFMGIYWLDEQGGRQLDQQKYPAVTKANNYSDAANKYMNTLSSWIDGNRSIARRFPSESNYQLFSSDYAFYWYDYKLGYDAVFAEFGANYSRQINIALCRGAATAFGKDWGVMITWTYQQPPYIESGAELYKDMVTAYESGAKYILIFDSDDDYSNSILKDEHFGNMSLFYQYVQDNPRTISTVSERTALVLPQYYAYGFRGPYDSIWGLWGPDSLTATVCMNVSDMLTTYGNNLDIIYPDANRTIDSIGYRNVLYAHDAQQNVAPSDKSKDLDIYVIAAASTIIAAGIAGALITLKIRKKQAREPIL